jgi:hypothetical protein
MRPADYIKRYKITISAEIEAVGRVVNNNPKTCEAVYDNQKPGLSDGQWPTDR